MDGQATTVAISGAVSLISAFGSILLKDHLDQRREMRKLVAGPRVEPVPPVAGPVREAPTSPAASPPQVETAEPTAAELASKVGTTVSAAATSPAALRRSSRRRSLVRAAATIAIGLAGGIFVAPHPSDVTVAITVGAMVATVIALLVFYVRRRNRSALGYQLAALTLWAAFFGGMSLRNGYIRNDTDSVFYLFWGASAIVGLIVFGLTYRLGRPVAAR